jgi:hypothetical protein
MTIQSRAKKKLRARNLFRIRCLINNLCGAAIVLATALFPGGSRQMRLKIHAV